MSPLLLESICVLDGAIQLLDYHQRRVTRSLASGSTLSLHHAISQVSLPASGKHKLRLLYNEQGEVELMECAPYEMRRIEKLMLRDASHLDYSSKWADRRELDALMEGVDAKDDVLLLRGKHVCEARYANIAFGEPGDWVTPKNVFLEGVMRQYLLDRGEMKLGAIAVDSIRDYPFLCLFNALIPINKQLIPTGRVVFPYYFGCS